MGEQLAEILRDLLGKNPSYADRFDDDGMKLLCFHCAMKGDIREALFLVKYIFDNVEFDQNITMDIVNRMRNQFHDPDPCITCIKKQTPIMKLVLAAYVKEARQTEEKLVNLKRVY